MRRKMMSKKYLVTARREIVYEKIVEAESEQEAIQVFYETKTDDDIVVDNGSEVEEVEDAEEEDDE